MTACLAALGLAPIPASARLAPMEVRAQAQQTGAISGNVVDQADSPVADVVVTTTDASGNIYTAATDADGAFTLPDLPAPASYVLTFTPPAGYGGATFTTGVSPGETFSIGYITVQAQPGAVVGVVTDQDGVPLDGMQVQVSSFVTTTTDSDGGYALAGLLPGSYPLTVIDGNDALAEGTVSIAGDTVTVNVTLPRPAVPAGTTARDAARDLGYLNAERAALGLPAGIVENTRWSTECAAHDHYLSENHLLQHPENLSQRGASVGGAWAGESAVLSEGARWRSDHNPWENAPIHLNQLFSPSLSVIGIDESRGYVCATTWPGMLRPAVTTDTIFTYPGNRSRGVPASEDANEEPFVPGQFVGIPEGRTAGRELFVYLNRPGEVGQAPVTILSAKMSSAAGPVHVRWVSTTTNEIGTYLAGGIVLPVKPLTRGTKYTVSVTIKDGAGELSHRWSFTTAGRAPKHLHGR
jgi:hypothetical protein